MKQFQKNRFVVLFIIVAAIIFLVSVILRLLTPYNPVLVTEFMENDSPIFSANFTEFSFGSTFVEIPPSFSLVNSTIENALPQYLYQLQETYNLEPHEQLNYLFIGPEYAVTVSIPENTITVSMTDQLFDYSPAPLNLETAKQKATDSIATTFSGFNLTPVDSEINIYPWGPDLYETTTLEEARVARIPFSFKINGYPVLLDKNFSYPAVATVTNDYITKIEINPTIINTADSFQKNAISVADAQSNIESGNYIVISFGDLTEGNVDLSTLTSVELTLTSIEYRFVPEAQQLVPFYVFTGTGSGQIHSDVPIKLITTAI